MAASLLPNSAFLISLFFGNIKRRGSLFLRAYPRSQALALPLLKDKQRKPAHAEWNYIIRHRHCYQQNTLIARNKPRYNTPTRTLRCITSVRRFKFARFDYTDSNVLKTSFSLWLPWQTVYSAAGFHWCLLWPAQPSNHRPLLSSDGTNWLCRLQKYKKEQHTSIFVNNYN